MKENEKTTDKNKNATYNTDVTINDKENLGERVVHQRKDKQGDDVQLNNRKPAVDFTGKDLDVPGREAPKSSHTKLKDEENELYSQGSGHNDHLEDVGNHS